MIQITVFTTEYNVFPCILEYIEYDLPIAAHLLLSCQEEGKK